MKDLNGTELTYQTTLMEDLPFKKVFFSRENMDITAYFLRDVAGIEVKELFISPSEEYSVEKFADREKENELLNTRVDLLAELEDGSRVTVEMQRRPQKFFAKRGLAYMAKGFVLGYGEDEREKGAEEAGAKLAGKGRSASSKYSSLRPIYGVNILNFCFHDAAVADPVMTYVLKNELHDLTLKDMSTGRDLWTMVFVELPKIGEDAPEILKQWRDLFVIGKVFGDAPEYLRRVAEIIRFENMSKEERKVILDFDEREAIRAAEDEYLVDKALAEERLQIAVNLLKRNYPFEEISEVTGLSPDEVQHLAENLRKQA